LSEILEVGQFFEYTRVIHKLFSQFTFKQFYKGGATKRLLETRWTGHLKVCETIHKNYQEMLNALHLCLEKKRVKEDGGTSEKLDTGPEDADLDIDGSVIIECRGLKKYYGRDKISIHTLRCSKTTTIY